MRFNGLRCVKAVLIALILLTAIISLFIALRLENLSAKLWGTQTETFDQQYAVSLDYVRHRMKNHVWVEKTGGLKKPENAIHFSSMPRIGQIHLHLTRFLYFFSIVAEKHHVRWSLMGGTLLGYLRHGDHVPHDHDVDVAVAESDVEMLVNGLNEQLPQDMMLSYFDSKKFAGPWIQNVFMMKLSLISDGSPSCCLDPKTRSRPCTFLDIWAYNKSRGIFGWWDQTQDIDQLEPRIKVKMGPAVAYIPDQSVDILTLSLCWIEDVKLRGKRDPSLPNTPMYLTSGTRACHGYMRYSPRRTESNAQICDESTYGYCPKHCHVSEGYPPCRCPR